MKPKKVADLNYYELLNLQVTANRDAIEQSYLQITSIYSENSISAYGAMSGADREWMLNRVQEAYSTLISAANRAKYDSEILSLSDDEREKIRKSIDAGEPDINPLHGIVIETMGTGSLEGRNGGFNGKQEGTSLQATPTRITGAHLRNVRVAKGASLESIAETTKINKMYLEAIEREDSKSFPAPVFIKGFLKSYAKALGLDPDEICERYLSKE